MPQVTIDQAMQIALEHHQAGRLQQAEQLYRQVVARAPGHADALHHLGLVAYQVGRKDVAVDLIRQSIALMPNYADAHFNLGIALGDTGQIDEAITAYRRAIALRPDYAEAHCSLGHALTSKGLVDEAIAACRRAIALRPGYAEGHNNLGNAFKHKGLLDEAIAAYRQAAGLRPGFAEAHYNLGIVLRDRGLLDESIAASRQAIALMPNHAEAHGNLGVALVDTGQLDEAIAACRWAIALRPSYAEAHSNLVLMLHCSGAHDARSIAEEHRRWNEQHAKPMPERLARHGNDRCPDRRVKIGYVSPDFRDHPVGRFVLPLLAHHDKGQCEVFAYARVRSPDAMTERCRRHVDHWRSTIGLSDEAMAGLVRQDQIDILVDLAGHSARGRLLVFARKPAPVQVTWLGYPDTTGLTAIDYRLTDAWADPPGLTDAYTTEELIRLPDTNWVYEAPVGAPLPADDATLHKATIVFGSFNHIAKVNEPTLKLWARILLAVPGSRLVLKDRGFGVPSVTNRVSRFFADAGVAPDRLDFRGGQLPTHEYMALVRQIAIALDPFPYHGTATTCDALWMGVPVVTMEGQTHASRVGVSLLNNVGLRELIAESPEEYVRIAVELANDRARLKGIGSSLRGRMLASPLTDAPRVLAHNIEAAYHQMWLWWCQSGGEPLNHYHASARE